MAYTLQVIARKAADLLRHCNIHDFNDVPVNLGNIAEKLDIKIFTQDFHDDKISGLLTLKGSQREIIVNEKHAHTRQRFTIAHEIGHYILHSQANDQVFLDAALYHRKTDQDEASLLIEIEANKFAAELLMPAPMVKAAIEEQEQINWFMYGDEGVDNDTLTEALAQKFDVSTAAMSIRLANLVLR